MANIQDIKRSLFDIQKQAEGVQSTVNTLAENERNLTRIPSTSETPLESSISGNFSKVLGDVSGQEKTIMERFAERRKLAGEGTKAQEELIKSEAGTALEEAKTLGERELTSELEARRGFATNTAALRSVQETGEKRIRDLTKVRDELLLQNKVAESKRLDDLLISEEESITTARQNWITNLFNLSTETRAQREEKRRELEFETPIQRTERELKTEQQKTIANLAIAAPDAGISQADIDSGDIFSVLNKYRNSSAYRQDIRKGELELKKLEADILQSNAIAAKNRADVANLQIDSSNPKNAALSRSIQFLTPGATEAQRKDIVRTFASLMQEGNENQAKEYVKRIARELAPTDENQKATGREEALTSLTVISNALNQYVEKGGDLGLISGIEEQIVSKIGRTKDPELARIANTIRLSIIDYRRAVSGAAFTESEMKEYNALFPNIGNVPRLNSAKIQSLQETFGRNQQLFYSRMLGPSNYNELFGEEMMTVAPQERSLTGQIGSDFLSNNLFGQLFK